MTTGRHLLALAVLAPLCAVQAFAQPVRAPAPEAPPAAGETETPYDARLARLAELIGALAYIRPLCGATGEDWRADMQKILDADAAREPQRRARLTSTFNRGFRAFAALHALCSPAALAAEARYRDEAATLVAEITGRFGN